MNTRTPRFRALLPVLAAGALVLAACGDDDSDDPPVDTDDTEDPVDTEPDVDEPADTDPPATDPDDDAADPPEGAGSLTVGSADFPESQLLAQIYGQALAEAGFDVSYELGIGSREIYYRALEGGEVDLVPEYTNSLLSYVIRLDDPDAAPVAATIDEQLLELEAVLPESLAALPASTAENRDVIVCTSDVADEHGLSGIPDLADVAGELTLGAPPEFEERSPWGAIGFRDNYGIEFGDFVPLPVGQVAEALAAGQLDCGNLFSTMPVIDTEGFVALADVDALVPHEAVLPLVRTEALDDTLESVLADINAGLDTDTLIELNVQVEVDLLAPDEVAAEWLAGR